jgi:hypothetical protein
VTSARCTSSTRSGSAGMHDRCIHKIPRTQKNRRTHQSRQVSILSNRSRRPSKPPGQVAGRHATTTPEPPVCWWGVSSNGTGIWYRPMIQPISGG